MNFPPQGETRSLRGLFWRLRPFEEKLAHQHAQNSGLDSLTARLLAMRGVGKGEGESFLNPTLRASLPDPSLILHMDRAVSVFMESMETGEKIAVLADYDVDGATSAAQLLRYGRLLGQDFELYVPDRLKEGYGPTPEAFQKLKAKGVSCVITVDCGAAAHTALKTAEDLGMKVIVLDHHLMQDEGPVATALVNPNAPDDTSGLGSLCAAGLTFLFLVAVNREGRKRGHWRKKGQKDLNAPPLQKSIFGKGSEPDILKFLDLVALGTICDVMPLTGVNRALVSQGLHVMAKGGNQGLMTLAKQANLTPPFQAWHAGFVFGPRLNAGGRLGRSDSATHLLIAEKEEEITRLASELEDANTDRKTVESRVLHAALHQVEQEETDSVIVVCGKDWAPGVLGLVAGRLKEKYNRPALVLSVDTTRDPHLAKGSGRSIKGVNLGEAVVRAREEGLLLAGGGHAMAAGMSLAPETLEDFSAFLREHLSDSLEKARTQAHLLLDGGVALSSLTLDFIEQLECLQPFGAGNPEPVFGLSHLRLVYVQPMGDGHLRLNLEDEAGSRARGVIFRAREQGLFDPLMQGQDKIWHMAVKVKKNSWQGRDRLDLHIVDAVEA